MSREGIVAICQFGGNFATNDDGSMSYAGGEAHAIDIDRNLTFDSLKLEMTSVLNTDVNNMSIKYFLPNNNRTLITVSGDKDLQRLIDFYGNSTVDVYIMNKVNKSNIVVDPSMSNIVTAANNRGVGHQKRKANMISSPNGRENWAISPDSIALDEICPYVPSSINDIITGVGQEFDNVKDFRDKLCEYAICKGFSYRFVKNETARVTVKCTAENCPWRIHASQTSRKKKIMIKKLIDVHTCGGGTSNVGQRRVTKKWLVNIIKKKLRDSPECRPKDIAEDVYRDFGINVSYFQVWHAKTEAEKELFNMHVEACNQLPWFCTKLMESNPGSIVNMATSEDSRFRLFITFQASLHGFEHGCRPLILLDTIPLQKNNQLRLLAAASIDADDGIFPIAFSAVECENYDSWTWFLDQLKSALTVSCPLTFVSNRGNGLEQAVPQVFEDSYHGYCLIDIVEDFRTELKKGSWSEMVENAMVNNLEASALACTEEEFNARLESIRKVSEAAADWVMATKPDHWSNALFKGSRYNNFSADISEFNNWISVRQESSVVLMIYIICSKVMELMNTRREASSAWESTLTPSVEEKLMKENSKAQKFEVLCSSGTVFEVRGGIVNVVNIETWDCTCRMWQLTGLPCIHAIAVLDHLGRSIHNYCSQYFTSDFYRAAYAESINPITGVEKISPIIRDSLHPASCRQTNGTRRSHYRGKRGDTRELHCSRCKETGHNKSTCETIM